MLRFDEIGYWSELKLEIVRKYAAAYSRILSRQPGLAHVYVDAFAGAGTHVSRTTGEFVAGSPLNALSIEPPFREYHLIDLDGDKVARLRAVVGERPDVHVHHGDCNRILLTDVFPRVRRNQARRGLCLLDPYGLHLDWKVVYTAGQMGTLEIFLNFPIMDMNRNVLWHNPEPVAPEDLERMDAFWGGDSWRQVAYDTSLNLFGFPERTPIETIAEAYRSRLHDVAGFPYVLEPLPMRSSVNTVVYFLFFASPNQTGARIVREIFSRYRGR